MFQYNSVIGPPETVKFDLGLRNDVLDNINSVELKTLLLEPFGGKEIFPRFQAAALTIEEAYAEKTRAALTRKEPAIRDFFDLWVAQEMGLLPLTSRYFEFLSKKLAMDRTAHIDMSFAKEKYLLAQIENELNTVLKKETASRFKFNEAWQLVKTIHATLTS